MQRETGLAERTQLPRARNREGAGPTEDARRSAFGCVELRVNKQPPASTSALLQPLCSSPAFAHTLQLLPPAPPASARVPIAQRPRSFPRASPARPLALAHHPSLARNHASLVSLPAFSGTLALLHNVRCHPCCHASPEHRRRLRPVLRWVQNWVPWMASPPRICTLYTYLRLRGAKRDRRTTIPTSRLAPTPSPFQAAGRKRRAPSRCRLSNPICCCANTSNDPARTVGATRRSLLTPWR
ncbi:hypothetical protein B0J12DRAFT_199700 [Macrophomina phaseolina]|uniref:Uncharacterized protein n=1 Tax=Macrophomina phaseolina TaxID=35725 RepID=A0ABQ8G384_9PEZI|nr:hypothetical protein B0J12DRAFT_199700 [Macrophomina phaseolina]